MAKKRNRGVSKLRYLRILCLAIGIIPYEHATVTQLSKVLRLQALATFQDSNIELPEDFTSTLSFVRQLQGASQESVIRMLYAMEAASLDGGVPSTFLMSSDLEDLDLSDLGLLNQGTTTIPDPVDAGWDTVWEDQNLQAHLGLN